jgi:hypothetical protein
LNQESITTTCGNPVVVPCVAANPLTVTVTVNWHDLRGRSRSKVIQTLFSG